MYKQELTQRQEMRLAQILSPRLIQMFKVFQLSYEKLIEQIKKESEENVFIEIIRGDELVSNALIKKPTSSHLINESEDIDPLDRISEEETLRTTLDKQLALECLAEKEYKIAQMLLDGIDERGYINDYAEIRDKITKTLNVKERKVTDVLKTIHTFEPEGVGARSLKECLLIQINEHNFSNERLREILKKVITYHLEDLAKENYKKIADSLNLEEESINQISDLIKNNLSPNPGALYSSSTYNYHIIPSFRAEYINGNLIIINLEKEKGIKINLSVKYEKILSDTSLDKETRAYLENQYKKAKEFHENIERRYENLEKIASLILEKQKLFLEKGEAWLNPLLQKNVAKELDISPSTVSRIVSSKYIETVYGNYSLKSLCPRDHFGKTAERLKRIIVNIIREKPAYSDEKISKVLKVQGINIARRTVTKYRLNSGEESSFGRKVPKNS